MGSHTAASQLPSLESPDTPGTCVPALPISPVLLCPVAEPQIQTPLLSSISSKGQLHIRDWVFYLTGRRDLLTHS